MSECQHSNHWQAMKAGGRTHCVMCDLARLDADRDEWRSKWLQESDKVVSHIVVNLQRHQRIRRKVLLTAPVMCGILLV